MKSKSIIFGVALFVCANATQTPVQFERKYKVGEKDTYKMNITASMSMGAAEVSFKMNQTVKKVYDNGDADIETAVTGMTITFGGNEMPGGADPEPTTTKVNKFGTDVGEKKDGPAGMMSQMDFSKYLAAVNGKALEVGKAIDIDVKNEKTKKQEVKGTVKLESLTEGVAKVVSDLEVFTAESTTPMKIKSTSLMDVATSKANKVQGVVTGMPEQQGMTIDKVEFTMERVKS